MSHTVVLVVGKDPLLLETRSRVLRTAGFTVVSSGSPEQAILQFLQGDFDVVVLCHTIPQDERRRLCRLLRQHTSRTPIVSVASFSGLRDWFVDATLESGPSELIAGVRDLFSGNGNHFGSMAAPPVGDGFAPGNEAQGTILYVDDDAGVLEVGSKLFQRAGYRVLAAQDGPEALRLFQAEAIDAVVLDYEMPGMNGGAVASQIRKVNHHIPVFLLSGVSDIPEIDRALFDGFIPKGGSFPILLAAIDQAFLPLRSNVTDCLYCPEGKARLTSCVWAAGKQVHEALTQALTQQWLEHLTSCEQCAHTHQVIKDAEFAQIVSPNINFA